ncbi:MAG: hypothetical protein U5K77_02005 [Candidatus Saccharibacteria bacterium]|nr:hypothetical protein [Candidatus Saccharibacteria bacterium]
MKTDDSKNTILNIKLSKSLKLEAQSIAKEMGIPLTTVVKAGLNDFVRSRSVTLSTSPKLKPEVERKLVEAAQEARQGKNISDKFTTLEEGFDWLDA